MNNTNHQTREFPSKLFSTYDQYTPGKLIDIAAEMQRAGIQSISFEVDHGYEGSCVFTCMECRLETDKERDQRVDTERTEANNRATWERMQYERLKRKFENEETN